MNKDSTVWPEVVNEHNGEQSTGLSLTKLVGRGPNLFSQDCMSKLQYDLSVIHIVKVRTLTTVLEKLIQNQNLDC